MSYEGKIIMKTSMFLLLREYADASYSPSAAYINAQSNIDEDAWLSWFNNWMAIAGYFRYEHCDRLYDGNNLKHTLYPYEVLKTCSEFPDISLYALTQLDYHGFLDCNDEYTDCKESRFFIYGNDVTADTLGKIARRQSEAQKVILLNADALTYPSPIPVACVIGNLTLEIDHGSDIKSLHEWFTHNRLPKRIFDYNPKHGDNHRRSQMISHSNKRAAQLECSKDEAEELLHNAVGHDIQSALWYWDSKVQKHIYFEYQRDNRLGFHGYHLEVGDENYDNIAIEKLEKVLGPSYNRKKAGLEYTVDKVK